MKRRFTITWALFVATTVIGLTSCDLHEDTDDCSIDFQVTFSFVKDGQEQFGNEIPSISMFVFDEQRKFVGRWDENDNTLFGREYTMKLPLAPGTYNFVVWGGLKDERYYVSSDNAPLGKITEPVAGVTDMDELLVRLTSATRLNEEGENANYVDYELGSLYHAIEQNVKISTRTDTRVEMDLHKDTKLINLTVIGLPPATRANPYPYFDITLAAADGGNDFYNEIESPAETMIYVQHGADAGAEPDTQVSRLYCLQMDIDKSYRMLLYDTSAGEEFFSVDLLSQVLRQIKAYDEQAEIDAEDVFDVTVDVRSNVAVVVTVNGWDVQIGGGPIQ
jgi:hypothetical protein